MSYTRSQWVDAFLNAIGDANPSQAIINWVGAWTDFETSAGGGAAYNLLNTTQREPGSTNFNSVGVQNFNSFSQGVSANAHVLENGLYPDILSALRANNISTLDTSSAVNRELSIWGTHVTGSQLGSHGFAGAGDTFSGTATGVTSTGSGSSGSSSTSSINPDTTGTSSGIGNGLIQITGLDGIGNFFKNAGIVVFGGLVIIFALWLIFR